MYIKFKGTCIDHSRDHDDVRAPESAWNDRRAGHLSEANVLRDQALHRYASTFYKDEPHIEAIFAEEAAVTGYP
jgi:hypothetical protein